MEFRNWYMYAFYFVLLQFSPFRLLFRCWFVLFLGTLSLWFISVFLQF